MKPDALQKLMRHKSYKTTFVYVNLASQLEVAAKKMPVPRVLQASKVEDTASPDSTVTAHEK